MPSGQVLMSTDVIAGAVQALQPYMIETLGAFVAAPSLSGAEQPAADFLEGVLVDMGLDCERILREDARGTAALFVRLRPGRRPPQPPGPPPAAAGRGEGPVDPLQRSPGRGPDGAALGPAPRSAPWSSTAGCTAAAPAT